MFLVISSPADGLGAISDMLKLQLKNDGQQPKSDPKWKRKPFPEWDPALSLRPSFPDPASPWWICQQAHVPGRLGSRRMASHILTHIPSSFPFSITHTHKQFHTLETQNKKMPSKDSKNLWVTFLVRTTPFDIGVIGILIKKVRRGLNIGNPQNTSTHFSSKLFKVFSKYYSTDSRSNHNTKVQRLCGHHIMKSVGGIRLRCPSHWF